MVKSGVDRLRVIQCSSRSIRVGLELLRDGHIWSLKSCSLYGESASSEGRSEVIKFGPGRFETCTVWSGSVLV